MFLKFYLSDDLSIRFNKNAISHNNLITTNSISVNKSVLLLYYLSRHDIQIIFCVYKCLTTVFILMSNVVFHRKLYLIIRNMEYK